MKKVYLLSSVALTVCLMLTSCNKEEFEQQPTEAEAITIAEEVLGFNFDPNQDWNMTQSGSIDVTANAGIEATEILILDAYPYGGTKAQILGQANVKEGQTVTVNYVAPKSLKSFYVACRNAKKEYRIINVVIGTTTASFVTETRGWGRRAEVASPSIQEVGYTFNGELAQSWLGVIAAEETGTDGLTYFGFMGGYIPWKNSGWSDKYYQLNASVIDSNISDEEAATLASVIMTEIPEGENNLAKALSTGYSITTTGGPVTLTPIFKNSNSGDKISYYYYPSNTTPTIEQLKAMKKYTVGEMGEPQTSGNNHFYKKTFSLVYEDGFGNLSYDFPEGYTINFIISNTYQREANQTIYESGGITTGGGESQSQLTSKGKFALSAGDTYQMGGDAYIDQCAQIKFGNTMNLPAFKAVKQGSTFSSTNGTEFKYYTEGNGVNGGLIGGCTAYYFMPKNSGEMTIGVSLGGGKTLKVVKFPSNQIAQATSGTEVYSYTNPDSQNSYQGTISFDVPNAWELYCVYAEGSKLGYYGFEFKKSDNTVYNHALPEGQVGTSYYFGQYFDFDGAQIYVGKTPALFNAAKSDSQATGYTAYTSGAAADGGLTGGATTYYVMPYNSGIMRVVVVLAANKNFYIKDLGNQNWNGTSGTSVEGYDGITVTSKYIGTYDFPVEASHVYAIYAEGSKLGFYGCEFLEQTGGSGSSGTVSEVVTKTIYNHPDYYGDGRLNQEVHQSGSWGLSGEYSHGITNLQTPHCAIYQFAGRTFVGFEDWIDFDYNDVIYEITGAEGGEEIIPDDPVYPIYSYAFEDSRNCDYDMNDVVIKATEDGDDIILKLVAAGATLDLNLRLYYWDEYAPSNNYYGTSYITLDYNDKTEVHEMMNVDKGYMINTNADNGRGANATPIEIRVPKSEFNDYRTLRLAVYVPAQKGKADYEMRLSGSGTAPYGVIIPEDWKWPREWVNVKTAYSQFEGFAETAGTNEEWYKTPTSGAVMDENGEY